MVRHIVPHRLDDERARALIEEAVAHYSSRYPSAQIEISWQSDTQADLHGTARSQTIQARVELQPGRCVVEVDVPFLLRPFQELARRAFDREVRRWLEREA